MPELSKEQRMEKVEQVKKFLIDHCDAGAEENNEDWFYKRDLETPLADMLADILHFCEFSGTDFNSALEQARKYFEEERERDW